MACQHQSRILDMSEEDWCKHYESVLDTKMDKSRGSESDPAACWLFTGRTSKAGYGKVDIVVPNLGKKTLTAHRLSYMVYVIKTFKLSQDLEASHRCGNRLCIRPSHIVGERHEQNKTRQVCHSLRNCVDHNPECIFP